MNASTIAAIVVISICQYFYVITEIILSVRTEPRVKSSVDRGTQRLIWIFVGICFVVGWVPVILGIGRLLVLGDWLTWVGVAIIIGGIIFRRYAIFILGKFFTARVQIQAGHELITSGPYRYIRHPSYLGIFLITLGLGIALANWISLSLCIVLPAIGIIRRIKVEEKELEQHFGKPYQDYRKVTWAVIPYIY
jgi:protein-S-isoprenylcysteine O-methyltransferase